MRVSMSPTALGDDQSAAVMTGILAGMLWLARWLGGRAMVYLLDAMLTQRARYQGRHAVCPSADLRAVR